MNDARIVALEMLQNPRPKVLGLANINPEGAEQTVDPGAFGRIAQDRFALKQKFAVPIFCERRTVLGDVGFVLLLVQKADLPIGSPPV